MESGLPLGKESAGQVRSQADLEVNLLHAMQAGARERQLLAAKRNSQRNAAT